MRCSGIVVKYALILAALYALSSFHLPCHSRLLDRRSEGRKSFFAHICKPGEVELQPAHVSNTSIDGYKRDTLLHPSIRLPAQSVL